jgi:molybdopterin-binding protein
MRWDRFFEDIEDQLASEWEAERAALDTEAERLRLSRLALHDRVAALVAVETDPVAVSIELAGGAVLTAPIAGLGADWLLASPWGSRTGAAIVPLSAVAGIALPHAELLRSARPHAAASGIARRATFGFAVRDIVRRRVAAAIHLRDGRALTGTIDRAGADHLDLAVHEPGAVRRAADVTGYRLVPFEAIAWIAVDGGAARGL